MNQKKTLGSFILHYSWFNFLYLSVSQWVMSMLMSVLCHNNYLEVLATPLVILETGERAWEPGADEI